MAPSRILRTKTRSSSRQGYAEERVAAVNARPVPLGGGESVTWSLIQRQPFALPHHLVALLDHCPGFASLPEHARSIAQQVEVGVTEVLGLLGQLRAHGLLATRQELLDALRSEGDSGPQDCQITLAMTTSARPHIAAVNLREYLAGSQFENVCLADDSMDEHDRSMNRQLAQESGAAYIGPRERQALANDLVARAKVSPELLSWALRSPSIGGNRNAVLLATAGSLIVSVDDDTTGLVARPPVREVGTVLVSSAPDPTEFWFDSLPRPDQFDLRSAHSEFLGRPISEVLQTGSFDLGTNGARIAFRSTGRISATTTGSVGDSGMGSARYLLRLTGASRDRLIANFDTALRTRRMLRAPIRPFLGPAGWFMTMAVGLDNREILPPFFPVGRNSDGLFGKVLRQVRPHDLVANLPLAVGHEPPIERSFIGKEAIRWKPSASDLLIPVVSRVDIPSSGPENRLRWLGCYLRELASRSESAFREELWSATADVQSRVTLHLESLLEVYGGHPQEWADSVKASIDLIRDVLTDFRFPNDLQIMVSSFGQMLEMWPEVFAAAVERNVSGNCGGSHRPP